MSCSEPSTAESEAAAGGLARYVVAAALARCGDAGAVVGIVLLVTADGGSGLLAGALAACITAPHLLGPFVGRRVDTAADGRRVIATACVLYAVTLAAAVLTWQTVPAVVTGVLVAAAGLCGPLLTGGISSRLPAIVGPDQRTQRRAQGWDVATYGIGGTVGPSVVAALSGWLSPAAALLALAAAVLVASVCVLRLPFSPPAHGGDTGAVPRPWPTLALMARHGRLRRTGYLTMIVALGMAALPVTAVQLTTVFGVGAAAAGVLTATYGAGNLAGSVVVMVRPLRGDPDRLMRVLAATVVLGLVAVVLSPGFGVAIAAYGIAGALNAAFFAATLAARTEFAPQHARGQVFIWVAALKITSASAGTALAGALTGFDARVPVVVGALLILAAVLASLTEHRIAGSRARARASSGVPYAATSCGRSDR
ncbi:MFS transporter [Pseudonocardia parietis]|uniref:MFS family permease n=1 Tax=Pseudonocardia parietis TaxID=570936 RepID=A0ABS4VRY1_9PSEU|nr:MFS transporter [Pseudonocardia parietis]MBP2366473.1 MFS family permease [Pseudonocardia parietis]